MKPKKKTHLLPDQGVDITIPEFPKTLIEEAEEDAAIFRKGNEARHKKHDAIATTLEVDALTPNGFLPEHIRNLLRDAMTKTD